MGLLNWLFGKKADPEQFDSIEQDRPISGDEIQKILDKPWSEVTIEERQKLCKPDPNFSIGKGDISMRIPKEVAQKLIQSSQIEEIPKKTVPITAIGNTDPICPYCNYKFDKMPQKKKKCPNCNNFIRSRKRPFDNKKVLLKEDQLNELGAQWFAKWEQSHPSMPQEYHPISEKAIRAGAQREIAQLKKDGLVPTITWVIPPEGCPIESHMLLDGQRVDAGKQFEVPSGEFKGAKAWQPIGFGEPALDYNCRCIMVVGFGKK
jgi:hypothetical protein